MRILTFLWVILLLSLPLAFASDFHWQVGGIYTDENGEKGIVTGVSKETRTIMWNKNLYNEEYNTSLAQALISEIRELKEILKNYSE